MSFKRILRRKLEREGKLVRINRHSTHYKGHEPAGWMLAHKALEILKERKEAEGRRQAAL